MKISLDKDIAIEEFSTLSQSLKNVLADEYILMNKVAVCLGSTSPFYHATSELFEEIYYLHKKNIFDLLHVLKANMQNVDVSIDLILDNARLSKTIDFTSKAFLIQTFLLENKIIAEAIDADIMNKLVRLHDDDTLFLQAVKEQHGIIGEMLQTYLTQIFNYNASLQ